MRRARTTLIALAAGLSAGLPASCGMLDCVKGTGNPVTRTLTVADLHGIHVQGSVDVQLVPGATQQVSVEGQANIIDLLETTVTDGIWIIRTRSCYSTDKPFIVHLQVPTIDAIRVEGSGDVSGSEAFNAGAVDLDVLGSGNVKVAFNAQRIRASIQGSGDIALIGSAPDLDLSVQGSGDVKAFGLQAERATVRVTGSGDVHVNVRASLNARVTGSGNVHYRGTPADVRSDVTGSGVVEADR